MRAARRPRACAAGSASAKVERRRRAGADDDDDDDDIDTRTTTAGIESSMKILSHFYRISPSLPSTPPCIHPA
jgi:hypothetical protein